MENGHPGYKFRKYCDDMRKKLRVDEKIQQEYGLKIDARKLEEKVLTEKEEQNFDEIEDDIIVKFRRIFKNAYHKIILTIFNTTILLKKTQRDYSIVFRFFGHTDEDIKEFIYEFNSFCEGKHPRYCGNHGDLKRFDGSKNTKDYRIYSFDRFDNVAVLIRHDDPSKETIVLETYEQPDTNSIEELRDNIEEFYEDENQELPPILRGRNNIYLTLQEKLSQFLSLVIVDDYSYYKTCKGGKLFLVDPYDYETLQIFFDFDLDKHPEKIEVVDVVTGKTLDYNYCINKFLVNVESRRAIIEQAYFVNKIEICENNRIKEIQAIGVKDLPLNPLTVDYNYDDEVKKIPTDKYLEMTILPLLSTVIC
jgi:hypothetical protein